MKQRSLFVFCIICGVAGFAEAQTKSLTNAGLENYRQERLKAELDYRENYAKWGFSSPEEMEKRREQSRLETEQLAARLRADELERERLDAGRQANERFVALYYGYSQSVTQQYVEPGYFWSYGRRYRFPVRRSYVQPGYFAGGQFWPTGSATKPQPLFRTRR